VCRYDSGTSAVVLKLFQQVNQHLRILTKKDFKKKLDAFAQNCAKNKPNKPLTPADVHNIHGTVSPHAGGPDAVSQH